ncbi:MAG: pilus assembly protein [Rhodospirillaceae bacterium]|nr:pilus assembly protein [Rhodospirillaceae bacterium]MDD9925984.1 pilus assembly protein [Rhodospirillaceae bacterium]
MIKILAHCLRCRRGSAITEFVLILPMMALLFAGTVEGTRLLRLDRKLQGAAYATADLITQRPSIDNDRMTDVLVAADMVMEPFVVEGLGVGVSSVVFDPVDGTPSVDWTESHRGGTVPDAVSQAAGMGPPGDSVVIVRATYEYVPLFGDLVFGTIALEELAFARPRRSSSVTRE